MPEFQPMPVAELRSLMEETGLTTVEVAQIVGLSRSGIHKWLYDNGDKPIENQAAVTILRMIRHRFAYLDDIKHHIANPGSVRVSGAVTTKRLSDC